MKLQLKRSLVVNNPVPLVGTRVTASGLAKVPTAGQMEFGELAVNYCNNDPSIFIETENGTIVEPYFKKNSLQHLTELGK